MVIFQHLIQKGGQTIMPIGSHLKIAAEQLRNAAQERRREADEMRSDLVIHEQEIKSRISSIEDEIQRKSAALLSRELDDHLKVAITRNIDELRKEKAEIERALNEQKANVDRMVREKMSHINDLNAQADQFAQMASQAD
jgi:uncharacterized protein YgbK (DUF1537 family)